MKKLKSKVKKFRWFCSYEKIHGSYHADNERCSACGKKPFNSIEEARESDVKYHKKHASHIYVATY